MNKFKSNLRKAVIERSRNMAAIVACLVVSMSFLSCDEDEGDNGNEATGKQKLAGHWQTKYYSTVNGMIATVYSNYVFSDKGTYQHILGLGLHEKVEGKYSVSDGKVLFTERKLYLCSFEQRLAHLRNAYDFLKYQFDEGPYERENKTMQYFFNSDADGAYLQIIDEGRTLEEMGSYAFKYRKQ
jgi:hypothetical protein